MEYRLTHIQCKYKLPVVIVITSDLRTGIRTTASDKDTGAKQNSVSEIPVKAVVLPDTKYTKIIQSRRHSEGMFQESLFPLGVSCTSVRQITQTITNAALKGPVTGATQFILKNSISLMDWYLSFSIKY